MVRQLLRLRGIGLNGAWVNTMEFFAWRDFHNGKEVGGSAGLTPTPYQSGDSSRERGMSKAGNRHVRALAIEIAASRTGVPPVLAARTVGVASLPAGERIESVVPEAVWGWKQSSEADRDRGAGQEVACGAVAISGDGAHTPRGGAENPLDLIQGGS